MKVFSLLSALLLGSVVVAPSFVSAQTGPDKASMQRVVDEICSDGGAWLKCYSLGPSRCHAITSAFVEPCVHKVMGADVDAQGVNAVAHLLMCFNKEFMAKYAAGEVKTPECKDPMKHLSRKQ